MAFETRPRLRPQPRRRSTRRGCCALLAIGLSFVTPAEALSLEDLLRLPIEKLLELKVASPRGGPSRQPGGGHVR